MIRLIKNSNNNNIGNCTRNLTACSAVPQPCAPPRTPYCLLKTVKSHFLFILWFSASSHCTVTWYSSTMLRNIPVHANFPLYTNKTTKQYFSHKERVFHWSSYVTATNQVLKAKWRGHVIQLILLTITLKIYSITLLLFLFYCLVSCVNTRMLLQFLFHGKFLTTDITTKWLLPCVASSVCRKITTLSKLFTA